MVAGDVVNTAARMQSGAPVNGILVGEGTFRATRHVIDYREAPPVEAKGKSEPVKVWEAVAAKSRFGSDVEQKLRTPLVGRERERNLLADALAHARAEQAAQLVTLVGVPGIGKSRLVAELFQIIEAEPELTSWRQGRSSALRRTRQLLGARRDRQGARRNPRVRRHGDRGGEARRDGRRARGGRARGRLAHTAYAAAGRPRGSRAHRAGGGVRRVAAVARGGGRAAHAGARLRRSPLGRRRAPRLRRPPRGLGNDRSAPHRRDGSPRAARPPARLGWRQAQRPHALDRRAVRRRDGRSCSSASSTGPCSTRTRNRRCCSAPRATRCTPRSTRGCWPSTKGGDLPLPETVQGLIAARIDGLAPEEKAVLQDASVIGKVFWPGALSGADQADPARARTQGVRPP